MNRSHPTCRHRAAPGRIAALMITVATLTGCNSSSPPAPESPTAASPRRETEKTIVEGRQPTDDQKQAMLDAKDDLFGALSGRLMEAMTQSGPVGAITVCQSEAPEIAERISRAHRLTIGRTGVRLRNPNNTAPSWAKTLVAEKTDTPTFAVLSTGEAAALLPIRLKPQCLMCHGPEEQIDPNVQSQLSKLYPNDAATGFKEGELRGWFWVELPQSDEAAETSSPVSE